MPWFLLSQSQAALLVHEYQVRFSSTVFVTDKIQYREMI